MSSEPAPEVLQAGRAALARGVWETARAAFAAMLQRDTESPEALEGVGLATWWLDDAATVFTAREAAYRVYRARCDARGAARVATWLAWDYGAFRGESAIANGWLERAQHLLEGLEPGHEHGWLYFHQGAAYRLQNEFRYLVAAA